MQVLWDVNHVLPANVMRICAVEWLIQGDKTKSTTLGLMPLHALTIFLWML